MTDECKCEHCEAKYILVPDENGRMDDRCCPPCKRCRVVLRRLVACERFRQSAHSLLSREIDDEGARDWKLSVRWALGRCGLGGSTVLLVRLTRQQHAQANSWKSVALKTGMTTEEAKLIYKIALAFFLGELDRRGIPDDYRDWMVAA